MSNILNKLITMGGGVYVDDSGNTTINFTRGNVYIFLGEVVDGVSIFDRLKEGQIITTNRFDISGNASYCVFFPPTYYSLTFKIPYILIPYAGNAFNLGDVKGGFIAHQA